MQSNRISSSPAHGGVRAGISRSTPFALAALKLTTSLAIASSCLLLPPSPASTPAERSSVVVAGFLLVWALVAANALSVVLRRDRRALDDQWAGTAVVVRA
jgi:hypothetical protein